MSLEEQVINLRQRVKKLQQSIQQKERSIKSVQQSNNISTISGGQQTTHINTILNLKETISTLTIQNNTLHLQLESKNNKIKTLQDQLLRIHKEEEYNHKLQKTLQRVHELTDIQKQTPESFRIFQLEEKVKIDQDIIIKLTEQISQKNKIVGSVSEMKGEISRLSAVISSVKEEKVQVDKALESAVNEVKSFKQKYHSEISKNNQYLETLHNVKAQLTESQHTIKNLEKQNAKLKQDIAKIKLDATSVKQTTQTEMNTEPMRVPKKSGNFDNTTLLAIPVIPTDSTKNNELLTNQIAKKNTQIKQLLNKISNIQAQNNKLFGGIETIKRDLESKKQIQKINSKTIQQQKLVIQNQRNTINNLQKEQSDYLSDYQNKVQILNKKLSLYSIPQQKSKVQLDNTNERKQKSERSKRNSNNSLQHQILEQQITDFPMIMNNNKGSDYSKMSNSVDYQRSDLDYKVTSPVSPTVFDISPTPTPTVGTSVNNNKPKIKRLEFQKLQKKFSTMTCNDRGEQAQPSKREEYQTKTVSARGIKSGRAPTPVQLKLNIKNILDNSMLSGKGAEFIEILIQFVKQIELFSGYPYQDITADLNKKNEAEKVAINTHLMKQITEITKIRHQCQQTIEQYKEESKERIRQKQEIINQLRVQNLKYQNEKQQSIDKIQKLEAIIEKSKKIQSQRQLSNKQILSKSNNGQPDGSVEKLKLEKSFLQQKLFKYQQAIELYDSAKRQLTEDNQKLKSQVAIYKNSFTIADDRLKQVQIDKNNKLKRLNQQSLQLLEQMIQQKMILSNRNAQLIILLKNKQQQVQQLIVENDKIKVQIKQRQNDLIQAGRVIHQINQQRRRNMNEQVQQSRQSINILKQQEEALKQILNEKQQTLARAEKQISRLRTQTANALKQLEEIKEINKSHLSDIRQLQQQITSLNNQILLLNKKSALAKQQQSFQSAKNSDEFEEILMKIYYVNKQKQQERLRELKLKARPQPNVFKTASSARLENEGVPMERMMEQYRDMKQMFKSITQTIYQTYSTLPIITNSMTLFQAQTKEQLLNQLNDIRIFADDYVKSKEELESSNKRIEQIYVNVIKRVIKNQEKVDQSQLNTIINELKISKKQQDKLRDNVSLIFSNKQIQSLEKSKKKIDISQQL